nr:hypothetical protein [Halobacterium sp. CBA1132]
MIKTNSSGDDVVSSHDLLGDFTSNLEQKITYEAQMEGMDKKDYPRFELLHDLLWKQEDLHKEYDAILTDPNARAEDLLYNSIYALEHSSHPSNLQAKGT